MRSLHLLSEPCGSTFPYAWCMETIVGDDVDLVSWDFDMMEVLSLTRIQTILVQGGNTYLSDGWLRHAALLRSHPVIMFRGGNRQRLAEYYGSLGLPVIYYNVLHGCAHELILAQADLALTTTYDRNVSDWLIKNGTMGTVPKLLKNLRECQ